MNTFVFVIIYRDTQTCLITEILDARDLSSIAIRFLKQYVGQNILKHPVKMPIFHTCIFYYCFSDH